MSNRSLIWSCVTTLTSRSWNLADRQNHTLYSLPPNYTLLAPAQSGPLGPLERHYIPQRIRAIHKTRLEHVGLWGLGGSTDAEEPKEGKEAAVAPGGTEIPRGWAGWGAGREVERRRRAWEGEQLAKRARGVLDVLSRRVGEGYFGGERCVYTSPHRLRMKASWWNGSMLRTGPTDAHIEEPQGSSLQDGRRLCVA